jgi:hypothetical protein
MMSAGRAFAFSPVARDPLDRLYATHIRQMLDCLVRGHLTTQLRRQGALTSLGDGDFGGETPAPNAGCDLG